MITKTTNYNLTKDDAMEFYDISKVNANMDKIDAAIKAVENKTDEVSLQLVDYTKQIPYAGTTTGTANTYAIAIPVITKLKEGMAISLKFNVDSTGASTLSWCSLGAKPIKKINGTDATNLKASGIYTLRYDGTNFILQGEGASGNATASDLILGKTASTDAGDITGTMPNNGAWNCTPKETDIIIPKGYHNGQGKVFAMAGGVYNFPLSIQDTQPTAERVGHIWIKSSKLLPQISKIKIVEAISAGESDGTLLFVVGNLQKIIANVSHSKTVNGSAKTISSSYGSVSSSYYWRVSCNVGGMINELYLNMPFVYSKIGGVLDVETAYHWNGSSWVLISQKGSYLATTMLSTSSGTSNTLGVYYQTGDTYTKSQDLTSGVSGYGMFAKGTQDGTYILYATESKYYNDYKLYKRNGDVFMEYTVNNLPSSNRWSYMISDDGSTFVCLAGTSYIAYVYKNNGSSFELYQTISIGLNSSVSPYFSTIWISPSGNEILIGCTASGSTYENYIGPIYLYVDRGNGYVSYGAITAKDGAYSYATNFMMYISSINAVIKDNTLLLMAGVNYNGNVGCYMARYTIDHTNNTTTHVKTILSAYIGTSNYFYNQFYKNAIIGNDLVLIIRGTSSSNIFSVYSISLDTIYNITNTSEMAAKFTNGSYITSMALNASQDRVAISSSSNNSIHIFKLTPNYSSPASTTMVYEQTISLSNVNIPIVTYLPRG